MATIHVDGKAFEVDGADNLLQACLSLGLDIPYFCWHPALGSVGACRQCAVKQYTDAGLNHLVFHAPGSDQRRFLELFEKDLAPRLRALEVRPEQG